jgi:hypothetical protein
VLAQAASDSASAAAQTPRQTRLFAPRANVTEC